MSGVGHDRERAQACSAAPDVQSGQDRLAPRHFGHRLHDQELSAEGASIAVDSAATLPAKFDLEFDGEKHHCTVAWRRVDRLGVKFG
jgi:hypothetical protein